MVMLFFYVLSIDIYVYLFKYYFSVQCVWFAHLTLRWYVSKNVDAFFCLTNLSIK